MTREHRSMRLRDLARNSSFVAAGNLAAAVGALAFRSVIAYRFGASEATDAFLAAFLTGEAFTVPLIWVLAATFIPTVTRVAARDADEAWLVARTLSVLTISVLAGCAFAVAVWAEPLAGWVVGRDRPQAVALTARMVPVFATTSVVAGLIGLLTSLRQMAGNFWLPALALPLRSVVALIVVMLAEQRFGIWAAVSGVALGYSCQAVLLAWRLLPRLLAGGRISPRHWAVVENIRLMVPMVVGTFLLQVNQLVGVGFASRLGQGAVTVLAYALAMASVAASAIGASVVDAAFPGLSRAAVLNDDRATFRRDVTLVVHVGLYVGGAAAAGLAASSTDVVSLLFGYGRFAGLATAETGAVLQVYGIGLWALIFPTVLTRVFYATRDTLTPQILGVAVLPVNAGLAWALLPFLGIRGIAFANLTGFTVLCGVLLAVLVQRDKAIETGRLRQAFLRALLVAAAVYCAMRGVRLACQPVGDDVSGIVVRLAAMGAAGLVAGAGLSFVFNEFRCREMVQQVLRRWSSSASAPRP